MKKIIFFVFIILFGLSVNITLAQALMPFGGQVVTAPVPGAVCPDVDFAPEDPFITTPTILTPPIVGPFQQTLSPLTQFGLIAPGSWILGLYLPVPLPDCTVVVPPIVSPIPVLRAVMWGTSLPLPI